eukprot:101835_1
MGNCSSNANNGFDHWIEDADDIKQFEENYSYEKDKVKTEKPTEFIPGIVHSNMNEEKVMIKIINKTLLTENKKETEIKENTQNEIKAIAQFLDIQINDNEIDKVVELCSLDKMRNNVKGTIQKQVFKDGGASFFHKGTNERWKGKLTDDQINQYKILAARYLDDDGIKWLETGNI